MDSTVYVTVRCLCVCLRMCTSQAVGLKLSFSGSAWRISRWGHNEVQCLIFCQKVGYSVFVCVGPCNIDTLSHSFSFPLSLSLALAL